MRRSVKFHLGDCTLHGTLDEGAAESGLLIVSGGNEIRIGAHRGMARLAQGIAARGHPVFRFDRCGIGDSEGENAGFRGSAEDMVAAVAAFRQVCPQMSRIVAFGNCDAATALVLHDVAFDTLVLANPWIIETVDALPPPAAIKARYARRLRDPNAWRALVIGKLNMRATIAGLRRVAADRPNGDSLAAQVAVRLAALRVQTIIIVADGDNTGIAFADAWQSPAFNAARSAGQVELLSIASSSHSFANESDFEFLADTLQKTLA